MFDQFTKLTAVTTAEMVEQTRRIATAVLSFVPHEPTKDVLATTINLQCSFADIYATQIDKASAAVKKAWAFPTTA